MLLISLAAAQAQPPLVPLLWTQGQPEATIRRVVGEVADGGNTGFVWESRPHPDYLGPGWWRDLGIAIDEARKRNLEVWIFDEWMYPSGIAGGKIAAEHPELANHVLVERSVTVRGPDSVKLDVPGGLGAGESLVSIAAFRPGQTPVDVTGRTEWTVPEGEWRILWAVSKATIPKAGWSMENMIDVLNPRAAQLFIQLTHDATYQHFPQEFGKTIKGFFSDETGFRNVTSYHSLPGSPGMPMPWSPVFIEEFRKYKGYDPRPLLAALWYDIGEKTPHTRYDLMDAYTHAFAENFFRPQQEWCRAHQVQLIGHVVEDNHADHNLGYGPGHWFRVMEYFDVPGIDIVGYQVTPGLDAGENWWLLSGEPWDEEFFQWGLPAMARGAALIKGKPHIFSEAFGANGWSEGLRMVKWIGDWHIINGIAFLSPHAVTMKEHDPDCPPHFNAASGNPQARYYKVWADYFRPLQKLIWETEPVYEAAVLYTAESAWMGPAQNAAPVVRILEQHQIPTAILPYETWAKEGELRDGRWEYHGQRFRAVILPRVKHAPPEVLARLADFQKTGGLGVLVDTTVELPELPRYLAELRKVDAPPSIQVARRRSANGEYVLLHNRSLTDTVLGLPPYTLRVVAPGEPLPAEAREHREAEQILKDWSRPLGDWRKQAGLEQFAGTLSYKLTLPGGATVLDAGEVYEIAELKVNGKSAGVRIAPPYRWDIGPLMRAGENEIEIEVTNTAQARWKDEFSRGDARSGLYGPVVVYRGRAQ